jgi:hypothetical protein
MKHRISYSQSEKLYHVQSKKFLSNWTNRNGYIVADKSGVIRKLSGFPTFTQAEEWMNDRYPGLNMLNNGHKNKNMGFEF